VNRIQDAAPVAANPVDATASKPRIGGQDDFMRLLTLGEASGIKFSKHALKRISARGISFDEQSIEKLDAAISVAKDKGANESLVLMDELALIVSVRNRTVITAMSSGDTRGNVFTSIDSAVIA
jgi:flagellar operon protein